MEPVRIRQCQENDLDRVAQLEMDWEAENITYGFVASDVGELYTHGFEYFYVAVCDDEIIGFIKGSERVSDGLAVIAKGEKYIEIDDIYVVAEYRNAGIGGELVTRLKTVAKEKGIERFLVFSETKDLDKILKFYNGLMFKPWGVQLFI